MSDLENKKIFLEERLENYLHILEKMVEVNSFTENPLGVDKLGMLTAGVFTPLGFEARFIQAEDHKFGKHLVLTKKGSGHSTIGLVSHLDTVFPEEEEKRNNFHWRVEGDKAYGPGSVDIKGGTVAILMLLDVLKKFHPGLFDITTWKILLNSAEEQLTPDFGALCRSELKSALACLVFEMGPFDGKRFKFVSARKGRLNARIKVSGIAAHAGSNHDEGANAIRELARVIEKIEGSTDYGKKLTFNIGSVSGGTVANRVPHEASAEFEMRAFSKEVFEEGLSILESLSKNSTVRTVKGNHGCRIEIEEISRTVPWPANIATEKLCSIWRETALGLGYEFEPEERGGLSDGNYTWDLIPTLDGLGPDGGNGHCSECDPKNGKEPEFVRISSFIPKTILNVEAIKALL